jgi:hypothetical protein
MRTRTHPQPRAKEGAGARSLRSPSKWEWAKWEWAQWEWAKWEWAKWEALRWLTVAIAGLGLIQAHADPHAPAAAGEGRSLRALAAASLQVGVGQVGVGAVGVG